MRDVLDHGPTWAAVLALAAELEVTSDDRDAAGRTLPYLDAPAREIAEALAPAGLAPRAEEFRDRVAALFG